MRIALKSPSAWCEASMVPTSTRPSGWPRQSWTLTTDRRGSRRGSWRRSCPRPSLVLEPHRPVQHLTDQQEHLLSTARLHQPPSQCSPHRSPRQADQKRLHRCNAGPRHSKGHERSKKPSGHVGKRAPPRMLSVSHTVCYNLAKSPPPPNIAICTGLQGGLVHSGTSGEMVVWDSDSDSDAILPHTTHGSSLDRGLAMWPLNRAFDAGQLNGKTITGYLLEER